MEGLDIHDVQSFIKTMESCGVLDRQKLLQIEFQLVSAFGWQVAESTHELHREMIENPDELLFMISNSYKHDTLPESAPSAEEKRLASVCRDVLMHIKLTPGVQRDGSFAEDKFWVFVNHLKKQACEKGYSKGMQHTLGQLVAYAPETANGDWPPQAICKLLDVQEYNALRGTFCAETRNKRGVTSRSPYEGGGQERELADKYDDYAQRCQIEYPLAAETLTNIAKSYRDEAIRCDRDAESIKNR